MGFIKCPQGKKLNYSTIRDYNLYHCNMYRGNLFDEGILIVELDYVYIMRKLRVGEQLSSYDGKHNMYSKYPQFISLYPKIEYVSNIRNRLSTIYSISLIGKYNPYIIKEQDNDLIGNLSFLKINDK